MGADKVGRGVPAEPSNIDSKSGSAGTPRPTLFVMHGSSYHIAEGREEALAALRRRRRGGTVRFVNDDLRGQFLQETRGMAGERLAVFGAAVAITESERLLRAG